jgi:hypothetical protein
VLAHGIGIYFIARGIFMGPALWMQEEQNENTRKLLELQEMQHSSAQTASRGSVIETVTTNGCERRRATIQNPNA